MIERRRCVLCGSEQITTERDGRFETRACAACGAVVRVEFDPPDDPSLRGRIDLLVEPRTTSTGTRRVPSSRRRKSIN